MRLAIKHCMFFCLLIFFVCLFFPMSKSSHSVCITTPVHLCIHSRDRVFNGETSPIATDILFGFTVISSNIWPTYEPLNILYFWLGVFYIWKNKTNYDIVANYSLANTNPYNLQDTQHWVINKKDDCSWVSWGLSEEKGKRSGGGH